MLVVRRKPGESVTINGELVVTVRKVTGGRVVLTFDGSPERFLVKRGELAPKSLNKSQGVSDGGGSNSVGSGTCRAESVDSRSGLGSGRLGGA